MHILIFINDDTAYRMDPRIRLDSIENDNIIIAANNRCFDLCMRVPNILVFPCHQSSDMISP